MKRVLVTHSGSNDGCMHYRVVEPYTNIKSERIEFVIPKENVLDDRVFDYDAVLLQRPYAKGLADAIKKIKAKGIKVVIETDDALELVPRNSPAANTFKGWVVENYLECLSLADYIHTSTPELHPKGIVFHNAINLEKYTVKKDVRKKTICWGGSSTHYDSLLLIKPVIEELLRMGKDCLMIGEEKFIRSVFKDDRLRTVGWVDFGSYHLVPSMADVFLTPLPNNAFNRCKSELKVLEAAAFGIPSVSSPVAPYLRFNEISNGGNIVVKEKFSSWMDAILSLLEDENLYKEKSEKSFNAIKNFYNLQNINNKRKTWWESILC